MGGLVTYMNDEKATISQEQEEMWLESITVISAARLKTIRTPLFFNGRVSDWLGSVLQKHSGWFESIHDLFLVFLTMIV